ncbi:UvrD-helicase domain-containing protein [Mesobacillus harenae]|uniref:UvrD-helicase domain-containing protein n=1 Tax=Mesobacillus harenae TaxID=2213203 RepID=UPI0015805AC4|nr:ATP-dependent helicase [Mesobacillus harenae]
MKTAFRKNNIIDLNKSGRELLQQLYDEGKKGLLSCHSCKEPVRLYLGIHEEPHFYHHLSNKPACFTPLKEVPSSSLQAEQEFIEQNGFRIPKSRSIGTIEAPAASFKKAEQVRVSVPFNPQPEPTEFDDKTYLQSLISKGIQLDIAQKKAIISTKGPLLVLAGAGSGKTRVLTARTAYLLEEEKADPRSVMLVTFTAKSAAEMKNRLAQYPNMSPATVNRIISGTFHSIFYRILTFHKPSVWGGDKLIKKEWQKQQMVKEAGKSLGLIDSEFAFDLALQQIGYWKNSLITPGSVKAQTPWEEQTASLYKMYEEMKQQRGVYDFDDMLTGCYELFKEDSALLEVYQNRFSYFLIDEFQDINRVQYELIKMLSAKNQNVCAVGDDDQSIYSFRGSDPGYLLQFEQDFKGAEVVVLEQNYRSGHDIVETANAIISANKVRRPKKMKAQSSCPSPIVFYPYDEEEEATMIITDIQEKIEKGARPADFAILFRTNTSSRAVFERLANSSLPFKLDQDMESFYERFIVKGILSFLRLSLNEDDTGAIKGILPALFMKQTVYRDLQAESILRDCSMLEAVSAVKTGFAFQERKLKRLVPIVRSLSKLSPLMAIEVVERDLGFSDFIKKRGSEGNMLEKGSDDIRDLKVAARSFPNLMDFLDHAAHMTAMNQEIKKLGKTRVDAITLSTIHRAKGLEYESVYISSTVDGSLPHDHALEAYRNGKEDGLEEERRLFYVAATRAKENLLISIPQTRRGRKAYPSRFLAKISRS